MPNTPQTRSEWKTLIEKQQGSRLTPGPFCEREQVSLNRFYYYRGVLFPKQIKRLKKSSFVRLKAQDVTSELVEIEIGTIKIKVAPSKLDFIVSLCRRLNSL
jgi:hypothetical protein